MGVRTGRWTAELEGDAVVFLLGMHVNHWRDVRAWWPITRAMPRMLRELDAQPELGMLHASAGWILGGPTVVQHWRSFEQLEAYARASHRAHLPAWRDFNRAARATDGVGVWHETYQVAAGSWESIYVDCPGLGLGAATGVRPLGSTSSAAARSGVRPEDVVTVAP